MQVLPIIFYFHVLKICFPHLHYSGKQEKANSDVDNELS